MTSSRIWQRKPFVACLMLVLIAPFPLSVAHAQQQTPPGKGQQAVPPIANHPPEANDELVASMTKSIAQAVTYPDSPTAVVAQASRSTPDSGSSQFRSEQRQNKQPIPVGTAAAPYEKTTGIAASKPAGAAIAPARQRRARSFLIRIGVVVGVAIAVGSVIALTEASPSHP